MAQSYPSAFWQQFCDANGNPIANGTVKTFYASDHSLPIQTYTYPNSGVKNRTSIMLDEAGRCTFALEDDIAYYLEIYTAQGELVGTYDNVTAGSGTGGPDSSLIFTSYDGTIKITRSGDRVDLSVVKDEGQSGTVTGSTIDANNKILFDSVLSGDVTVNDGNIVVEASKLYHITVEMELTNITPGRDYSYCSLVDNEGNAHSFSIDDSRTTQWIDLSWDIRPSGGLLTLSLSVPSGSSINLVSAKAYLHMVNPIAGGNGVAVDDKTIKGEGTLTDPLHSESIYYVRFGVTTYREIQEAFDKKMNLVLIAPAIGTNAGYQYAYLNYKSAVMFEFCYRHSKAIGIRSPGNEGIDRNIIYKCYSSYGQVTDYWTVEYREVSPYVEAGARAHQDYNAKSASIFISPSADTYENGDNTVLGLSRERNLQVKTEAFSETIRETAIGGMTSNNSFSNGYRINVSDFRNIDTPCTFYVAPTEGQSLDPQTVTLDLSNMYRAVNGTDVDMSEQKASAPTINLGLFQVVPQEYHEPIYKNLDRGISIGSMDYNVTTKTITVPLYMVTNRTFYRSRSNNTLILALYIVVDREVFFFKGCQGFYGHASLVKFHLEYDVDGIATVVEEAPNDSKQYVRKNNAWEEVDVQPREQADWNQADSEAPDYIKNKPDLSVYATTTELTQGLATKQDTINDLSTIRSGAQSGATAVQPSDLSTVATTGSYNDLSNKPDLSVYATTTELTNGLATKQDTISDLSTIRSGASAGATAVQPSDLATVATTGDYNDLSNRPTIPAAQVNSDWNASSGVAEILNKPTLATVATSGSYNDLTNKPAESALVAGSNITITEAGSVVTIASAYPVFGTITV